MNNALELNVNLDNGYCKECGACGHAVCCPPTDCNMKGNNQHCKSYLQDLKIGFTCYTKLFSLLATNKEKIR
jgi:hypothetical protein